MSACLPLWLVKYGGAPVALVAEVDRASAARAANAGLMHDAAIGDMVVIASCTARPGVRGVVAGLRNKEPERPSRALAPPTTSSDAREFAEAQMTMVMLLLAIIRVPGPGPEINLRLQGDRSPAKRNRDKPDDDRLAARGFIAACRSASLTAQEARESREFVAVDVRHGFWQAARNAGLSARIIAATTGTHSRSVRNYFKDGGRGGPDYTAAFLAATESMRDSQSGA